MGNASIGRLAPRILATAGPGSPGLSPCLSCGWQEPDNQSWHLLPAWCALVRSWSQEQDLGLEPKAL